MSLDLAEYETKAQTAIQAFWSNRRDAREKQIQSGKADQGERSGVTAGKNMDGFVTLIVDLVKANGLPEGSVYLQRRVLTLPGYFRPTKVWDLLVVNQSKLVAAIEFKSQVGPSFGNNFNNRIEEALGTAVDFWKIFREGGLGNTTAPFLGWLMLLEDTPKSRSPVKDRTVHFPILPEFDGASYADRYNIFCRKLVQEKFYTSACLILSKQDDINTGRFVETDALTSLKTFVVELAGHIAIEAAK